MSSIGTANTQRGRVWLDASARSHGSVMGELPVKPWRLFCCNDDALCVHVLIGPSFGATLESFSYPIVCLRLEPRVPVCLSLTVATVPSSTPIVSPLTMVLCIVRV